MFAKTACVLISGRMGAGKSTLANYMNSYIQSLLDYTSFIGSFSAVLKQAATIVFGWNGIKDAKGRKLLQGIGSVGREYNKDIWANYLYKNIPIGTDFIIIDDWRYDNERKVSEDKVSMKVYKIRITSPNEIINDHESENSLPIENLDYYDFVVNNDSDLESLRKLAKEIVNIIIDNHPIF